MLRAGVVVRLGPARFTVRAVRRATKGWLVLFDGVTDRDAAQRLVGRELHAAREALPALGANEHYLADLVGFRVVTVGGAEIGTIDGELGGVPQPTLIVKRAGAKDLLVPAIEGIVIAVDEAARVVTIDPPDGLLDL